MHPMVSRSHPASRRLFYQSPRLRERNTYQEAIIASFAVDRTECYRAASAWLGSAARGRQNAAEIIGNGLAKIASAFSDPTMTGLGLAAVIRAHLRSHGVRP